MNGRSASLCLALGAGVVLSLTACDGLGGQGGTGGPAGGGEAPSVIKGSQLKGMLLPAGEVPQGLKADPEATTDSRDVIADPSAAALPGGKGACKDLQATAWIGTVKIQSATFAQGTFISDDGAKQFNQEIDVFHAGEGPKVMERIAAMLKRCASFTYKEQGTTVHVRGELGEVPGFEGDGVKMRFTAREFLGGTAIAAVRVKDTVVTTSYSYTGKEAGVAADAVTRIARKVKAGS